MQSFCKTKDTVNRTKQQPTDWEMFFMNSTSDRGLISNIYKELKKLYSREPNNPIKNEEMQMAKKHLKKCSTTLVRRKMKVKITLRFHLTPVRMAKIKNSGDSRCLWGCGRRGTLLHCLWFCKLLQLLWKSGWMFHRQLGIVLPEDPAIPVRDICPKDALTYNKATWSTNS